MTMIRMVLRQVLEARNLPDTDNFFLSKLINRKDVTDPYVSGYLDTTKVCKARDDDEEEKDIDNVQKEWLTHL